MTERSGVEIDYCPKCRGVWLDRRELDKAIERSAPAPSSAGSYRGGHDRGYKTQKRKKESFLGELFDF